MTEPPRRPILSLKVARPAPGPPPGPTPRPASKFAPKPPPPPEPDWKCKPCGTAFAFDTALADADVVRCPKCNAKLGVAGEFRQDPPPERLRARPVKKAAR